MLTLIRREIADNLLYVVFVGIVVASAIWISVYGMLWAQEPEMVGMAAGLFVPLALRVLRPGRRADVRRSGPEAILHHQMGCEGIRRGKGPE